MHVLRAEKGYIIVGQETDGTVVPDDLGLGRMAGANKPDFVGKRSLTRPDMLKPGRKQLVGLRTLDQRQALAVDQRDAAARYGAAQATAALAQPSASVATQSLSVGTHALTASYSGGGDYTGSTSNIINLTVNKAATATAFSSTPSPAVVNLGSSLVFNIIVSTTATNAPLKPSGTVTFFNTTTGTTIYTAIAGCSTTSTTNSCDSVKDRVSTTDTICSSL